MAGFSRAALKAAEIAFNRSAGQYRRYYGIDTSVYTEGVHTPKGYERALAEMRRDIERERIAQQVAAREAEERARIEREEFEAQLSISNFKEFLSQNMVSIRSAAAWAAAEKSLNAILSIIDRAADIHGYTTTWERLQPYAAGADDKLERLILAIYSKHYNTNNFWGIPDQQGETGRNRYIHDMESFAADLGVNAGVLVYAVFD